MRDPNRIDPFLQELGKIWKENVPDWRFAQLIENVFSATPNLTYFMEEDRVIVEFKNYFKVDKKKGIKKNGKRKKSA